MSSLRSNRNVLSCAVTAALALSLVGCAGGPKMARVESTGPKEFKQAQRQSEKGIGAAEKAVLAQPQSASLRAQLGLAYLQSGRFASASTAYDDAMKLGDNSAHTALGLALAAIGAGNGSGAVAILDDWRDSIPASDLGLALALAGETSRGVAILSDSLRGGDNSPKLRQNLAYAYALDGRWREARTMMEQDVPANVIDQRISDWALSAKPDDFQKRVAGLLGVPVRTDPGLPQRLALTNSGAIEQAAAETTAVQPVAVATPNPAAPIAEVAVADVAQPAVTNYEPNSNSTPVVQSTFDNSMASSTQGDASAASPQAYAPNMVAAAPARQRPNRTVRVTLPAAKPTVMHNGSHLVQLGSFSSPQGARRGWGILAARNPKLREFRMVITPAVVRGKNFWRVAAAGFDANSASSMCSTVKNRGGVCFAYASNRAPAGVQMAKAVKPVKGSAGSALARKR